jgi:parallel beta-helix repeat protein
VNSRDVRRFGVLLAALVAATGASVALAGAALPGASPFEAPSSTDATQRTVSSCTTIDEPGTYVLTSEIQNGGETAISQACFEITADGVTLDGNGHLVDGRGESHTKGIAVVGAENVTVRNVSVDDWHAGVLVTEGSATIRNVETYSNTYGVRLENATGATVENSTIRNNLVGVSAIGEDVELSNNDFSENEIEIQREE